MKRGVGAVSLWLGICLTALAAGPGADEAGGGSEQAVKAMLQDFHRAGVEADGERLFGHLLPDAIIFGTDKTERFTVAEYKAFVEPYLSKGIGWTSVPTEQNVFVSDDGQFAWFDERLDKPGFDELRGTGVLRKVDGAWKVAQFNLAFTVPNELARDLAADIRDLEKKP